MLSNATNISYKPLKIQSDYSVSNIHKEIYTQSLQEELKKLGAVGSGYAEWYLPPQSYIHAHSYLTSNTANPLSFQNTLEQEQLLASKATNQMQDFLNTPNLANFKRNEVSLNNNDSKNTFGGYATDEYGFMGEEFLKVANLPSDYKIHKNVLQAFNDFYTISIYSNYKSIDLIAGISAANKEFNTLFTDDKPSYTKEEILQFTKESKEKFYEEDFNALLMQDYKNEKGEFKREGIMLMYAMKSDALENTPSP
ncbi:MAG: hypothetical protein K2I63_02065, partial [Helicobacter sp.]|nr:hypothetical protein [Helicobacter sp.]